MTILDTMDPKTAFCSEFEKRESSGSGSTSAWLLPIRKAAIARFEELGFPTTRDEDWKYTNAAPISATIFGGAETVEPSALEPELGALLYDRAGEDRIVFVNGQYEESLSSIAAAPDGVEIGNLATAIKEQRPILQQHLTRHAGFEDNAFCALNTALFGEGLYVCVPAGTILTRPIHAVFVSTAGENAHAAHPRNLIVAGSDSQFSVLESYVGLGRGIYLNNTVTEVVAADNARIEHCKTVREAQQAFHIGSLHIYQQRSSTVKGHTVSTGGALVRNNITTCLDGEGCHCTLNGLNMLSGDQHVDNHLRVEHAKPHCDSREYFKGVYDDRAHGVFSGRIVVHEDAQKTDAKQTNKSLLLSDEALADSKPQLEIFADDVKCTHGATIGQLDDTAVFYLRSRGISEPAARSVLIYAFANEILETLEYKALRDHLRELLLARLPGGQLLRGAP